MIAATKRKSCSPDDAVFCACGGAWFGSHKRIGEEHIRRAGCREVSHAQFKFQFRCNCDRCDDDDAACDS